MKNFVINFMGHVMKNYVIIFLVFFLSYSLCFTQQGESKFLNSISEDKSLLEMPKPYHRFIEFMKQRAYPNVEVDREQRIRAIQDAKKILKQKNNKLLTHSQQPVWENIGPYNVGGRVKAIVVHPTNPDLVYIGAAAGGIWRSKDGGANWEPIFDSYNAIAVGSLFIDQNNPDIIYAGTGEAVIGFANDFRGTPTYLGYGIYKSTDAGDTWEYLALSNVGAISRICVHPQNSNLLYVGAVERQSGFYVSTDAGQTWERTRTDQVTDVAINPNDQNEVVVGVNGRGTFFSDDKGKNWQNISGKFKDNCSRVSIQISQSNPSIYYVLLEEGSEELARIYRTENKGLDWDLVHLGNNSFFNGQGGYDNYIVIKPDDPSIALAGGIDIWRTMNSGGYWSNVTHGYSGGFVHVDQQCAAFSPSHPSVVYAGNDGGMYKSVDAGLSWININNDIQITQFYALGIDHKKDNVNYGGTQDNGTLGKINDGFWSRVGGGDGFRTFVHPDNSNLVYGETYYGNLWELNLSTGAGRNFTNGVLAGDEGAWCTPFIPDYSNPGVFYHGLRVLYAYYFSGHWYPLTPVYNNTFSAIAVSPVNYEHIYAGNEVGMLIYSSNMGEDWTDVSKNGLVLRFITDIAASYEDEDIAYVTYSGYNHPHVFMTTDAGQSWVNISKNLPDIPVSAIVVNPKNDDNLYVATDIGVFTTYDRGEVWLPFGKNLPRVPVLDIEFRNPDNFDDLMLRIATHGRSMWQAIVPDIPVSEPEITSPAGGEIFISSSNTLLAWWGFTAPVKIDFSPDDGETWKVIATNVVGNNMLWKVDHFKTEVARIRVSSQTDQSQSKISNIFTIKLLEVGGVINDGFVSFIPYGIAWDRRGGLWASAFDDGYLYKLNPETFEIIKKVDVPGDSLFTDLTLDRNNGIVYMHQLESTTDFIGGRIIKLDTNGTFINEYESPAGKYPIGLELVDGVLIVGDREYPRMLTSVVPGSGAFVSSAENPYNKSYGPRGLCYDGEKYLYQICTFFPGGGSLSEALLIRIDKDDLSEYTESMELEDANGMINARGIDYDTRDKSFWVSDFSGNLYKIAGFDMIINVEDESEDAIDVIEARLFPNPASEFTNISFKYAGEPADITISMVNILGQSVGTFFDEFVISGDVRLVSINTIDIDNGIYYLVYYVKGKKVKTQKLSIVK